MHFLTNIGQPIKISWTMTLLWLHHGKMPNLTEIIGNSATTEIKLVSQEIVTDRIERKLVSGIKFSVMDQ